MNNLNTFITSKLDSFLRTNRNVQSALDFASKKEAVIDKYIHEIQLLIDEYNSNSQLDETLFINSTYLKTVYKENLPPYSFVYKKLIVDDDLADQVFSELRDSDYFHEVFEISNNKYLLINLLILVYRTTLLHSINNLRERNAQISSTLEEMAAKRMLEGYENIVFEATKHWILNWEEEGFSQKLAIKIKGMR